MKESKQCPFNEKKCGTWCKLMKEKECVFERIKSSIDDIDLYSPMSGLQSSISAELDRLQEK